MRKTFGYGRISDFETKKTINKIFDRYKLIVDPHTAVGLSAWEMNNLIKKKEEYIWLQLTTVNLSKQ